MKRLIDIIRISKQRCKAGGLGYLLSNVAGYPQRYIRNRIQAPQIKRLVSRLHNYSLNEKNKLSNNNDRIIVSLTSYDKRVSYLGDTLKSILMQSVLPDRLIVYFGSDTLESQIPQDIIAYKEYGVEFRYDAQINLKPHKKYYYAIQEFPNSIIITIDDDIIYPETFIETLLATHKKYKDAVCATRVHRITFTKDKKIKKYETWKKEYTRYSKPSKDLIAIGCGGVLYPPGSIDERAFDENSIISYCINADDIWLKCMELLKGTMVVYSPLNIPIALTPGTQDTALTKTNTGISAQNDIYIHKLMKVYQIKDADFF